MNNAAKQYCDSHPLVAYISALNGIEIHGIEYGIDDYIYCETGAWGGNKMHQYHCVKINYTKSGSPYINLYGCRYSLDDALRMNITQ